MRKPIDICGFLMLDKNVIAHPRYVGRTHEKENPVPSHSKLSDCVHKKITIWNFILFSKNK